MRSLGRSCILSGTALLLITAAWPAAASTNDKPVTVDSLVPMPDFIEVPAPTAKDIGAMPAAPSPGAASPAATPSDSPVGAPAATVPQPSTADLAVADKLRELMASRLDRVLDRRKDRPGVETFYSARNFAPLWITSGEANERAKAVMVYLSAVEADGLDPTDYPTPNFSTPGDVTALAEAELRLTAVVLTYARHAQIGRVHFSRIASDVFYNNLDAPEAADVLGRLAEAKNAGEVLAGWQPQHPAYKALKDKLAEARGQKGDVGPARIPHGKTLKVGMQDDRVVLLRKRLGVSGEAGDTTFDKPLAEAVKAFQRQKKLSANGTLNNATIDAFNGPRRDRDADIIIANMERWRWVPRDLGKIHVIVNIPDFTLRVMRGGSLHWTTKIVVGKPTQPTPITSAAMQFITVNPTWNVPPSIIQNEYLPALQQDPQAMERIGLKVETNRDGTLRIYQPPGDRNALGRIRFNFPNKFLVYQHDTPDKHLFAHDKRAYSHGCMRVNDPLKYGEVLLSLVLPKEGYTAERLRRMFGAAEQNIQFPTAIPVHLTYQTAYVDDGGKLVIRDDIYGRDARVLAALKGDERKVADIPVEQRQTTISRPVQAPANFRASYAQGPSLFDMLFGSSPTPPQPVASGRSRRIR